MTIDHIYGDGAAFRRTYWRSSTVNWRWVRDTESTEQSPRDCPRMWFGSKFQSSKRISMRAARPHGERELDAGPRPRSDLAGSPHSDRHNSLLPLAAQREPEWR